jgi:hypothetical protein
VDLAVVDRLARLRLRAGVRVVRASPELWALIDLCGLRDALGLEVTAARPPSPSGKSGGQAESREERLRVEEERQLCDLPVHDLDHL